MQRHDAQHEILTGSFYPELETALRDRVAAFRRRHGPLTSLPVLVSSNLLKVYLRRRLVELGLPHIAVEFLTLQDVANRILRCSGHKRRILPPFADELIADRLVKERVTDNSYFGPVREAAGFRACLLAVFKDLKEAGITPVEFASLFPHTTGTTREKLSQLAGLYAEYDRLLEQYEADDVSGAFARAANCDHDPFPKDSPLFLYGFYDFNYIQRKLIARLAAKHPLTVFFPYFPSAKGTRTYVGGAFVYAEPTLRWFEILLGVEAGLPELSDAPSLPDTLAEFRSRLFNEQRESPPPPPDKACLEILSAPHEAVEVREILRAALKFCQGKQDTAVAPARKLYQVAVLPRQAEPYGTLLRETAEVRGIKTHIATGRSLLDEPAARAYLKMLEIAQTDFGRAQVIEFACLAPLQPEQFLPSDLVRGFAPAEWDRLSAALGIVGGLDRWRKRLSRRLNGLRQESERAISGVETESAPVADEYVVVAALRAFVDALASKLGSISEASWSQHTQNTLAAFRALTQPSDAVRQVTATVERLAELDPFSPPISLAVFAEFARKALASEAVRDTRFEDGGIFVGGLVAARGLTWPMVVLPGLVEKTFPRLVREDPILLDDERKLINALYPDDTLSVCGAARRSVQPTNQPASDGLPLRLDLKVRGHDEERMLFQLAVESARERLLLTYPRMEPATGRPRVPSMLLLYATEALTAKPPDYSQLEKNPVFTRVRLNVRTPPEPLLDETEENLSLFAECRARNIRRAGPLLESISPQMLDGVRCEQTRWGTPAFTNYDGVLSHPTALATVAALLAPSSQVFSPTAFEQFARCPRCYFEHYLLGIEEIEEPEEAMLLPPREVGALVHAVLRQTLKRLRSRGLLPLRADQRAEHRRILEEVAAKWFAEFERQGFTGIPLLWEVQQQSLLSDFHKFLEMEYVAQQDGTTPIEFEWDFGTAESGVPPAQVTLADGTVLSFHGRIDRVDRAADSHFKVIDYKTGQPASKWSPSCGQNRLIRSPLYGGRLLQVPIYVLATAALGGRANCGELYFVSTRGNFERLQWRGPILEAALEQLPKMLEVFLHSMRQGIFYQSPDCRRCGGSALSHAAVQTLFEMKRGDKRLAVLLETTAL